MAGKNKRSGRGYGESQSSCMPSISFLASGAYGGQASAAGFGVAESPDLTEASAIEQALLMQLVGMDNAYQGLFRTILASLDEQTKKKLAKSSQFKEWANSLEFFRNNDTLPGLQFTRIQRPSCVANMALAI